MKCMHCKQTNHNVENCYHITKPKCNYCKKIGHHEKQCYVKKFANKPKKEKEKQIKDAIKKPETNLAKDNTEAETLNIMDLDARKEDLLMLLDEYINQDAYYSIPFENDNSHMYSMSGWPILDLQITSRTGMLFITFKPTLEATILRVGGKISSIEGQGTVPLTACNGVCKCTIKLEQVNYIPSNKYNIFALGLWDD